MKYLDVLNLKPKSSRDEEELSIFNFFVRLGGLSIISIMSVTLKEDRKIPSITALLSGYLIGVILYDMLKNIPPVLLIKNGTTKIIFGEQRT